MARDPDDNSGPTSPSLRSGSGGPSAHSSLIVCNENAGGSFAAQALKTEFLPSDLALLSFDYRIGPDSKVNFLLKSARGEFIIEFTGGSAVAPGQTCLGAISGVVPDNQWHHAEFDLYQMLRAQSPELSDFRVLSLRLMDTGWRGNAERAEFHIDNFRIIGVSAADPLILRWDASDPTGIAGASYVLDDSPDTEPDTVVVTNARPLGLGILPEGNRFFHIRVVDGAGNWSATAHFPVYVGG